MTRGTRPVLLCFDGSEGSARAIAQAGALLAARRAVVLTVWEPLATWEPYDPVTILSSPVSKAAARALDLPAIAREVAEDRIKQGVSLAARAGFSAEGRSEQGKPWRAICDIAAEEDAESIVMGARGLSRVQSMLLGSVSLAVLVHAHRPVLIVPPAGD